jgi:hypothetical protein
LVWYAWFGRKNCNHCAFAWFGKLGLAEKAAMIVHLLDLVHLIWLHLFGLACLVWQKKLP